MVNKIFSKNQILSAFTLVETMISTAILVMIAGVMASLLLVGQGHVSTIEDIIERDSLVQVAFMKIQQEFRNLGEESFVSFASDGLWDSTVTYQIPSSISDSGITWDSNLVTLSLSDQALIRSHNGVDQTLVSNLDSLRFKRDALSPDVVVIEIQKQDRNSQGIIYQKIFESSVYLRN